MTKVLIFCCTFALIFSSSFLKADSNHFNGSGFIQSESNLESVEEDLSIPEIPMATLPIQGRPMIDIGANIAGVEEGFSIPEIPMATLPIQGRSFNFSVLSLISQPAVQESPKMSIFVNIFPVLKIKSKNFMREMEDPGVFRQTVDLGGVTFTSMNGPFHLYTKDGKILGDGSHLSFNLNSNTFTLDATEARFQPLIISQDPEAVTRVDWQSTKGPVTLYYEKNFIVTQEVTPDNQSTIKVINVQDFDRYVSLVLPNELNPQGIPFAVVEGMLTTIRTYSLGKIITRRQQRDLDFDVFGSTQDQLFTPKLFAEDENNKLKRVTEDPNVVLAVAKTANKVIFSGGRIANNTMYSSNCGGKSQSYEDYSHGQSRVAYLESVAELNKDDLRKLSTGTTTFNLTTQDLASKLRLSGAKFSDPEVLKVEPMKLNHSDRAMFLKFQGPRSSVIIPTDGPVFSKLQKNLRKYADKRAEEKDLRSYMDPALAVGNNITIKSYGDGHNVGLCQWGAVFMAKQLGNDPKAYLKILNYYYQGTTVQKFQPLLRN